jgi:hypothetical protein
MRINKGCWMRKYKSSNSNRNKHMSNKNPMKRRKPKSYKKCKERRKNYKKCNN